MSIVIVIALVAVYFLPSIVAETRRKHTGTAGVVIVNLFLGWTLIGWLVAFVWACTGKTDRDVKAEQRRHDELLAALRPAVTHAPTEREARRASHMLKMDRVKF